jgi:hypothetical protein
VWRRFAPKPPRAPPLKLKASESGIIAPTEQADLRRKMGEDQYQQEFECSFEAAIKGAFYAEHMRAMLAEGRIKEGEYTPWATKSVPLATRAASPAVDLPSTLGMSAGNQCRINKSSTAGSEEPKQSHSSSETPWSCLLRNMP